ncbi:MAG TPA: hypothetical protein VNM72_15370, partial [Blastocatellia bacterium]|nr:hypothetical protein [Blastocatellia bacterium]
RASVPEPLLRASGTDGLNRRSDQRRCRFARVFLMVFRHGLSDGSRPGKSLGTDPPSCFIFRSPEEHRDVTSPADAPPPMSCEKNASVAPPRADATLGFLYGAAPRPGYQVIWARI